MRFSLIPTVLLKVDIPVSMDGSWYDCQVFVGIKEAVFEPSSALRHASELHDILLTEIGMKSVLFLYTDGGPGHRTTYVHINSTISYCSLPESQSRLPLCCQDCSSQFLEESGGEDDVHP